MDNFLILHGAVTILCSPLLFIGHLDYADRLLRYFVNAYQYAAMEVSRTNFMA